MSSDFFKNTNDLLYAEEWGLMSDDVGKAVAQSFYYDCAEAFEHELLPKRVRDHKIEMIKCPFPKPNRLNSGDFVLGFQQDQTPIKCPFDFMGAPSLICGSTGSGKTTTARYWCLQAGMLARGAWFIDSRKREMRVLQPVFKKAGVPLAIVDVYSLKINPLQVPEGVNPNLFVPNVADALVKTLKLPPTAQKILHQSLHHLYRRHGIFDGNTTNYPTLFELRDFVCNARNFHAQARDALVTALDPLLLSLRDVLCCRKGWSISELAKRKIVFEFNSCSDASRNLLVNTLLLSEFQSRVAKGYSNVSPDLFIYIDEGSQLIESDDATISQWAGLIRGVGLSLLISNQSAVSISQKVLSNIPNRFIAQSSSFADLQVLGSAIGLDASAKRYLSTNLRPGLLLGSLSQGSWRHPFLFTTPLMNFPCSQIDESTNKELEALPVVPAPEFENWEPEWARQEVISTEEAKVAVSAQKPDTLPLPNLGLSKDEMRLLQAVITDPCQPVSFFPTKLQMSTKTIQRLRKSLVIKNMIQEQQMQSSGRGRPSTLLAPTQHALETLGIE